MRFLKPGVSFCINLEPFYKILAICKWNFLEIPIQSIQKSLNLLFQCTMFLMFPLFKKYPGQNQQSGKQCCLPHLSFKISLKDTSFNISLNSLLRVLPLSTMLVAFSHNACCIFSNLCFSPCARKNFRVLVFTFLENALNLCIFTHAPVPSPQSRQNFLRICFAQDERGGGNYDLMLQNSIRKCEDDLQQQLYFL